MVSPSPAAPSRPLQPDTPANKESITPGHFLLSYGFQLVALLLGLAMAFL